MDLKMELEKGCDGSRKISFNILLQGEFRVDGGLVDESEEKGREYQISDPIQG